eukprot:858783_1
MHKEVRFCSETAKIAHMFLERAKNVQIINIESIENKYLFDQYYDQKQLVLKYVGADKLNERYLFHGTTQQAMADIVQDGFRKEYSKRARFGEGTYFATSAGYAAQYCQARHSEPGNAHGKRTYKMLVCKVICGESYAGHPGITLTNWPKKQDGHLYDSLVDKHQHEPSRPTIYVIHKDARAYPMFIISFCYEESREELISKLIKGSVASIRKCRWPHLMSNHKAGPNGVGLYLGDKLHAFLRQNNIGRGAHLLKIGSTDVSTWQYTAVKAALDQFLTSSHQSRFGRLIFRNR